jgi:TonB family protein
MRSAITLVLALTTIAVAQQAAQTATSPEFAKFGSPGVTPPEVVKKKNPKYTREAREAELEGLVMVEADIGPDGCVHNARVLRPLGMGLDERAVDAVKKWKFKPAMKDGNPVWMQVTVEVLFRQSVRP